MEKWKKSHETIHFINLPKAICIMGFLDEIPDFNAIAV